MDEKKLDDLRSPLRFLLGHTELQKELGGLQGNCDASGTCELAGVPKGLEQRVLLSGSLPLPTGRFGR